MQENRDFSLLLLVTRESRQQAIQEIIEVLFQKVMSSVEKMNSKAGRESQFQLVGWPGRVHIYKMQFQEDHAVIYLETCG